MNLNLAKIGTNEDDNNKGKFVPRVLSIEDQNKIRENAARERIEAEERMAAREASGDIASTLAEMDAVLDDWLKVNEGRHLTNKKDKAGYLAEAKVAGLVATEIEMPAITTTLELPETGGLEDN